MAPRDNDRSQGQVGCLGRAGQQGQVGSLRFGRVRTGSVRSGCQGLGGPSSASVQQMPGGPGTEACSHMFFLGIFKRGI